MNFVFVWLLLVGPNNLPVSIHLSEMACTQTAAVVVAEKTRSCEKKMVPAAVLSKLIAAA